ncbi:MAG TPA: antitoxin VbhA family protein [Terracidiphilus sp.]|nr:antitoxin VbhA family protein [Terracidiphilus sp.]
MATLPKRTVQNLERRTEVSSVLASFRMEGLEPDAETASLIQQYADGALSIEELGSAIERHVAQIDLGRTHQRTA